MIADQGAGGIHGEGTGRIGGRVSGAAADIPRFGEDADQGMAVVGHIDEPQVAVGVLRHGPDGLGGRVPGQEEGAGEPEAGRHNGADNFHYVFLR